MIVLIFKDWSTETLYQTNLYDLVDIAKRYERKHPRYIVGFKGNTPVSYYDVLTGKSVIRL